MKKRKKRHRKKREPRYHRRSWRSPRAAVAPQDIIREDFARLVAGNRLRTSQLVEELILMQSIEGHAHEGHAAFSGRRFVNTTMQDAVQALGKSTRMVADQRQGLIDEVADWAEAAAGGEGGELLCTPEGQCLFDMGIFRQIEIVPREVLQGIYLGGLRDNSEVRVAVEEKYGIAIGGGETALVDVQKMEEMGLDADQLAHGEWAHRMEEFRENGMIVEYSGDEARRLRFLYIRHRKGGGTSDDAAILAVGRLFGPSAALGAFLADAIDTFEKYVPLDAYADQDDELALWVKENVPDLGVTEEDLHNVTYLCAVPPHEHKQVPDSSLRWMLSIDRKVDQTALESHLAYLQGRPYGPMELAFERVPNQEFYDWFEQQMSSFGGK